MSSSKRSRPEKGTITPKDLPIPRTYPEFLARLKEKIRTVQVKAALSANRELIWMYWDIGRAIVKRQQTEAWGSKVIDRLAGDLQTEFPELSGFSRTNIYRMRSFHLAYPDADQIVPQAGGQIPGRTIPPTVGETADLVVPHAGGQSRKLVLLDLLGQIPWRHNTDLVERVKEPEARMWYAQKTIEHGWSRSVLGIQIETDLYRRHGKALTNFESTLPAPQSDLASQVLKDPYIFGFLTLDAAARERELELGLLDHIQRFLLELGIGFAFAGRQVHLEVGEDDFYIDLLFYHLNLRCFVVIDLKMGPFIPEYAGKMNFYLSAVDDQLRHLDDMPSIGLILCRSKNKLQVEYALRDMKKPIGVAEWKTKIVKSLPKKFKGSLPTIEELEAELGNVDMKRDKK
ncbi:MAG: PDDEXK nuclease domain-containing protein [Candidatus Eisenbacteria bacterium]